MALVLVSVVLVRLAVPVLGWVVSGEWGVGKMTQQLEGGRARR